MHCIWTRLWLQPPHQHAKYTARSVTEAVHSYCSSSAQGATLSRASKEVLMQRRFCTSALITKRIHYISKMAPQFCQHSPNLGTTFVFIYLKECKYYEYKYLTCPVMKPKKFTYKYCRQISAADHSPPPLTNGDQQSDHCYCGSSLSKFFLVHWPSDIRILRNSSPLTYADWVFLRC